MTRERLHNRPDQAAVRRQLRNQGTRAEAALWRALKGSQLEGRKFRRQHGIGPYVVDFYCAAEQLVIELDGAGHYGVSGGLYDGERTAYLERQGMRVIRFENREVWGAFEKVLEAIRGSFRRGGSAGGYGAG